MNKFKHYDRFVNRHIGPDSLEIETMLKTIGCKSLDELINQTVPKKIRLKDSLELGEAMSETELLNNLNELADKNKVFKSFIGLGYYGTITPNVILRNILENPGWYTAYTPYQAEIAQGRLEALLNFQTMVVDLTGLEVANASLLDEATAAAEAMHMLYASRKPEKKNTNKFFVSQNCFPQTIDVLKTRSAPQNIELVIGDENKTDLSDEFFGLLVQYPDVNGNVNDYTKLFADANAKNIFCVAAADILSLTLLKPPGEFGADVVVGSTQRFGVPIGYGGPHAAYFACKDEFRRLIPGRIIGVSVDKHGDKAYRMALQTREQHIRREKATSNICTAQVLLAVISSMYAVYHGQKGIKAIGERVHQLTILLDKCLKQLNIKQENEFYFDTLKIHADNKSISGLKKKFEENEINVRYGKDFIGVSIDETTELNDIEQIVRIISGKNDFRIDAVADDKSSDDKIPNALKRTSHYLTNPVFNSYHSETEMLRYMKRLENKDLALNHSMIPLGSCTMKLNATAEMIPVTWQAYGGIHPFAPVEQTQGYQKIFSELEKDLAKITGFDAVSLQPNSGAQGEYAGLMVIRAYHIDRGEGHRNVVLIPSSAHGTNPASAVMAGMKVVVIKTTQSGDIDFEDMKLKAEQHKNDLSVLMVTYPSTHGVFEEHIKDICDVIHANGGQVYMDGANMNAQIGLTSPAMIGADVCHLNLHKTFCIPHGGGGPGMGPIGVAKHLATYLPGNPLIKTGGEKSIHAISAAPWGSASILIISYAYIKMMGGDGLTDATKISILNANYIKSRLEKNFKELYSGKQGRVAHELIFDMREFKRTANVEVEDIAKRLMDYGFHAPTVSFPVPGTIMVEPTESEPLDELDRFCEAMLSIRKEIAEIESGSADKTDNVLKNAPHTAKHLISDEWKHSYSREKAAYPLDWVRENKFWPSVGRVDNAYGDRNFVCSCPPMESYDD